MSANDSALKLVAILLFRLANNSLSSSSVRVLFLLFLSLIPSLADMVTPDQVAIEFLQAVRAGRVKVAAGSGTAISGYASGNKLEQINGQLSRLARDLGQNELRVGQVKIDDDLAAVMVWLDQGNDPSDMQVFPIALVKRDKRWLPAPVLGSFENCGIGLNLETRTRIEALENWMLTQRTLDLAKLRSLCIERMRERISQTISRSVVEGMSRRQMLERFLLASQRRHTDELLALLGAFSDPLPDYWPDLVRSLQKANDRKEPTPWRLVMADDVLRVELDMSERALPIMNDDPGVIPAPEDDELITLACLDPVAAPSSKDGRPFLQWVRLEINKTDDGLWRVRPPNYFWEEQSESWGEADPALDQPEMDAFPAAVRKAYPARPMATWEEATQSLIDTLENKRFVEVLPLLHIDKDPQRGLASILHAAHLWSTLREDSGATSATTRQLLLQLDQRVIDQQAFIICQQYSSRRPDRFNSTLLHLRQEESMWSWVANPEEAQFEAFEDWLTERMHHWKTWWRDPLVRDVPVVEVAPTTEAPTDAECRELMARWFQAIRDGDIRGALACCALLKLPDSQLVILRNLGYEITASLRTTPKQEYDRSQSHAGWTAVSTLHSTGETTNFPMYPVVNTPKGPRILLEIDLITSSERGRRFLNQTSITRLRHFDDAAAQTIADLFEKHQQAHSKQAEDSP